MGTGATLGLFGGLVATIGCLAFFGPIAALIVGATTGLGVLLFSRPDRYGKTLFLKLRERVGWARSRRVGAHLYRSGPLAQVPMGSHRLPGVLSRISMVEGQDALSRPFAMIQYPATRGVSRGTRFAVVVETSPDGAALVDQAQIDRWVDGWATWLTALADEPGLVAATVTVETAPDTGERLRAEAEARLDPHAPALATEVLAQTLAGAAGSSSLRGWVTLVFSGRDDAAKVCRDVAARLPALTRGLEATGAGAARPCTGRDVIELVRVAYDPASWVAVDAARGDHDLKLSDVGPATCESRWDCYRHDSGLSRTWEMAAAPRGVVGAQILARLLAPHRDVARKRVTLVYKPVDPGRAAAMVEADLSTAVHAADTGRTKARETLAVAQARKTAQEEAAGAGLVTFAMLVTATVPAEGDLVAMDAALAMLANTARLSLRPCYGSQDAAFAAALPLGLVFGDVLTVRGAA